MEIERVAVLGGGLMGSGIAETVAVAGFDVVLREVDERCVWGAGIRWGRCGFIGLDVLYSVCDSLYEEFKSPEYAPQPLMKRMVASNRLGRKSGRGFYECGQDRAAVPA